MGSLVQAGAVRVGAVSDEEKLRQRAAICALKYCAYTLGYLAAGDASQAEKCSQQAKKLGDTACDAGLPIDQVLARVLVAEYVLSTLDSRLT
jgi:hypothetical protein